MDTNKERFQLYPRIVLCGDDQLRDKQGIHLRQPSVWVLEHALEDALKDNFEVIYCHFPRGSDSSRLDIEQDMLAAFFRFALRDGVTTDVASTEAI